MEIYFWSSKVVDEKKNKKARRAACDTREYEGKG